MFHVEHWKSYSRVILGIQWLGFLLAFSKSAFLGLFIGFLYLIYRMFHVEQWNNQRDKPLFFAKNVPRGTLEHIRNTIKRIWSRCFLWRGQYPFFQKMFHVAHSLSIIAVVFIVMVTIYFSTRVNWQFFLFQPYFERMFLQNGYLLLIKDNIIYGVGLGQSVWLMQNYFPEKLLSWQWQPVHSVYLLILGETGLIGLFLFLSGGVLFLRKVFSQNVPRGTSSYVLLMHILTTLLIIIGIIACFDHYFWDIQQGQLLFWLLIGFLSSTILTKYR